MLERLKQKLNDRSTLLGKLWYFAVKLDTRIDKHHTFMLASGIAFNILLYLLPLFLIAVYVVRMLLGEQEIISLINDLAKDFLPPTSGTRDILSEIIKEVELLVEYSSVLGIIGGIVLLWLSSALISSFRSSLNTIFDISSPHVFIIYRFKDMLLILVITILILLYSYIVPIVTFILSNITDLFPGGLSDYFNSVAIYGVSLITSFFLFYFIFRFVPNKRIDRKPRIFATLSSVFLIEVSRHIFAWYISSISNYGKFYGTYAIVVTAALWIYYSSLIILLSAEVGKLIFDIKAEKSDEYETIGSD